MVRLVTIARPPDIGWLGPSAPDNVAPLAAHQSQPGPPPANTLERRTTPPARVGLNVLAVLALGFALHMQFGSALHHSRGQQVAYAELRGQLAAATAPVGASDTDGHALALGTPIAVLEAPAAGIREVILEGTSGGVLQGGPGHRRDSAFPGQPGTCVLYGRQATYGGPFRHLSRLLPGDLVSVTTGQGQSTYKVLDRRRAGDLQPPTLTGGGGRLVLSTSEGSAFLPSGVFSVDADLTSGVRSASAASPVALLPSEAAMASDTSALTGLLLWSQLLLVLTLAFTWSLLRWGRWQTWVVAIPVLAATGIALADQAGRLLPNLM
jgi:sortase A